MAGLCAVGVWEGMGDRFVAVAADGDASPVGGVLNTSADDPTSFEGPADYPDMRSWIGAQLAEFGRE
ncbi:MAG: hypothetical protein JWM87_4677 [Candidatus Eremiobacteraeota bacterium]|nr:hypothetical protein [Candidatus Eremiobacteraeota bacterium]